MTEPTSVNDLLESALKKLGEQTRMPAAFNQVPGADNAPSPIEQTKHQYTTLGGSDSEHSQMT